MNILVINGPNLNLLGMRNIEIYGSDTLEDIMVWLKNTPEASSHTFKFYQSNYEGKIIDSIHDEKDWAQGILINPAAFTHYSYAIRDAIESVNTPTVEVHLSDIKNREEFREISVLEGVCLEQIYGLGKMVYLKGLKILINNFQKEQCNDN
tara:strand:+ start:673 stop:1125 length:453 start_codon:yes stop_codon:yes gene_type:complete